MEDLLDKFICTKTEENGNINIMYSLSGVTGTCQYRKVEMKGQNKPFIQKFYVMTQCDMGDVIEYIHKVRGLSEKDFDEVNLVTRNHSLRMVQDLDL